MTQAAILPGNMIYIGITLVSAKLYANSVLAVYVPPPPPPPPPRPQLARTCAHRSPPLSPAG